MGIFFTHAGPVYTPTLVEMEEFSDLLKLVVKGEFPGTEKTRPGSHGPIPIWNQRTAILYYNRRQMGEPILWLTLSMGVMKNANLLISNKKTWMHVWKDADPSKFAEMETYLPRTWSDISSFERDVEKGDLYVYKPVLGYGGEGISFRKGHEMVSSILEKEESRDTSSWVVQEFINPLLYNGKKTHIRPLTLIIVQPDGSREFYMYKKMRIFMAAEDFDEDRLVDGGDNSFMLLTNMHQSKILFERNPDNKGIKFSSSDCIVDAQEAIDTMGGEHSFQEFFTKIRDMHQIIYSIIGDLVECTSTDISIYNDSCFHIMASDVAFDNSGKPYFLEMNNAMGYSPVWTNEEQSEFSSGVAALIKGTMSPYTVHDSSMWERIGA